jgi:hypothetical protein
MRRSLASLVVLCVMAIPLLAQDGGGGVKPASQSWNLGSSSESLAGLMAVKLYVVTDAEALPPGMIEQVTSAVGLELRKTGIRILPEGQDPDSTGGLLAVVITRTSRSLSTDWHVRFELLQLASMIRIPAPTWFNTWSHREAALNGTPEAVAPMIQRTTNLFLTDWLTANGR